MTVLPYQEGPWTDGHMVVCDDGLARRPAAELRDIYRRHVVLVVPDGQADEAGTEPAAARRPGAAPPLRELSAPAPTREALRRAGADEAAATGDLRGAIGFSSFGVLVHYGVAHASAGSLTPDEGRPRRLVPAVGPAGCLVPAFTLPASSVIWGVAVLAVGVAAYGVRRAVAARVP